MASNNKRTLKTPEQSKVLEDYYSKGMTCYKQDNIEARKMLAEAVSATGLEEWQVKV